MELQNQNVKMLISVNLNRLMQEKGKSRKEICKELDIKYTTFCDWTNGKTYPRIESLEKLADYFGIYVGDFFIDFEHVNQMEDRVMAYAVRMNEISLDVAAQLPEEQLRNLMKMGLHIKKKTLEDYVAEAGHTVMQASEELDWGQPAEGELW